MAKKYILAALVGAALIAGLSVSTQAVAGRYTYTVDCLKDYHCVAYKEPTTFGVLAREAESFEAFRRLNKLPDTVGPNTPAPAFTMYAYEKRT